MFHLSSCPVRAAEEAVGTSDLAHGANNTSKAAPAESSNCPITIPDKFNLVFQEESPTDLSLPKIFRAHVPARPVQPVLHHVLFAGVFPLGESLSTQSVSSSPAPHCVPKQSEGSQRTPHQVVWPKGHTLDTFTGPPLQCGIGSTQAWETTELSACLGGPPRRTRSQLAHSGGTSASWPGRVARGFPGAEQMRRKDRPPQKGGSARGEQGCGGWGAWQEQSWGRREEPGCCAGHSPDIKCTPREGPRWYLGKKALRDHSTTAPCISLLHPNLEEPRAEAGGSSQKLGGQRPRIDRARPHSYTLGTQAPSRTGAPGPVPAWGWAQCPQEQATGQKQGQGNSLLLDTGRRHHPDRPSPPPGLLPRGTLCHFLLQGIFPTQESNLGLTHCRQTLLPSEPPGKPLISRLLSILSNGYLKNSKPILEIQSMSRTHISIEHTFQN